MEREEEAVMVAVLKSLVEEEPFHSSSVIDAQSESSSSSPMANFGFLLKCGKKRESIFDFQMCRLFEFWGFGLGFQL